MTYRLTQNGKTIATHTTKHACFTEAQERRLVVKINGHLFLIDGAVISEGRE